METTLKPTIENIIKKWQPIIDKLIETEKKVITVEHNTFLCEYAEYFGTINNGNMSSIYHNSIGYPTIIENKLVNFNISLLTVTLKTLLEVDIHKLNYSFFESKPENHTIVFKDDCVEFVPADNSGVSLSTYQILKITKLINDYNYFENKELLDLIKTSLIKHLNENISIVYDKIVIGNLLYAVEIDNSTLSIMSRYALNN